MHNNAIGCEMCGKVTSRLVWISKQWHGDFKKMFVCQECLEKHKRELEMTRENFYRQFGDN